MYPRSKKFSNFRQFGTKILSSSKYKPPFHQRKPFFNSLIAYSLTKLGNLRKISRSSHQRYFVKIRKIHRKTQCQSLFFNKRFCPSTGIYGSEKTSILKYLTQWIQKSETHIWQRNEETFILNISYFALRILENFFNNFSDLWRTAPGRALTLADEIFGGEKLVLTRHK